MTEPESRILNAFAQASVRELTSNALADQTRMSVSALYPLLVRLEESGVLQSRWAEGPKPRGRIYTLASTKSPSQAAAYSPHHDEFPQPAPKPPPPAADSYARANFAPIDWIRLGQKPGPCV